MPNVYTEFLKQIPPVTRVITVTGASLYILGRLSIINPSIVFNSWGYLPHSFELWRPFTALIAISGDPISALIQAYQIYNYSTDIEQNKFQNITAKYVWWFTWMAMFIWIGDYLFLDFPSYTGAVMMALTYTWVQEHKLNQVSFYVVSFSAQYLVAVNLAVAVLSNPESGFTAVLGLLAAHTYYYLDTIYPTVYPNHGRFKIVEPPKFLYKLFGNESSAYTSDIGTSSRGTTPGWSPTVTSASAGPGAAPGAAGVAGTAGTAGTAGATATGAAARGGGGTFTGRGQRLGT